MYIRVNEIALGDRRAAFVQAWAIVKAGGIEIAVKGVTFGRRQEALRRLAAYRPDRVRALLVPEPSNPADPAAVAVKVGIRGGRGFYTIEYVPRNLTAVVVAIARQFPAFRVVSGTDGLYTETTYGGRIALSV